MLYMVQFKDKVFVVLDYKVLNQRGQINKREIYSMIIAMTLELSEARVGSKYTGPGFRISLIRG